jgi:hypothetical protein
VILFTYTGRTALEPALQNSTPAGKITDRLRDSNSAEWVALLECASPHADLTRLRELLRRVSWPSLLTLAEEHGVIALLAANLPRFEERLVPQATAQRIRDAHRNQALSALKMTAELFRLIDLFRAAQLNVMVVKGPTLAVRAYGDSSARTYGDLDFLLRHKDIFRATEVMTTAGYQADVSTQAISAGKIPGQYLFVRTASPLLVELHTERTMRYFPRGLPLEDFFSRRQDVTVDGHNIPALCNEDELLLISIHGAKHLWERLNLVADVASLIARQPNLDWDSTFRSSRNIGADRMLHIGLLLAHNLLRAPLPQNIQARIQADTPASRLAAQITARLPSAGHAPPGLLSRAIFRVRMRGNALSGLAYLLKLTFSPTQEDWSAAGGEKPAGHLANLSRPVRLAKKYGARKEKS